MRAFLFEHAEITDCHLMYSYGTRTLVYGIEPGGGTCSKPHAVGVIDRATYVTVAFQGQRPLRCRRVSSFARKLDFAGIMAGGMTYENTGFGKAMFVSRLCAGEVRS